ncbi:uncharacterized protein MONOS_11772 [Monocercomonoides exilis]|uniref:uncharacterized protein n=1 Tax=Monocercomonoides exilis TaxID=2049356 RepID=UPI00355A496E|nr:hypothetical protein MONOS_11772 [Monocercomonoides exilis]|eukprot:MONOS_11772.1-p1 / transcript=MONOS_11772.1 / gene=MONOS_11772 / organism=Monocercomonoides_exilis_PA203 / gene_product=unspecified product / transcript_product=unspecified product / location=Mono_scaffold00609:22558-23007(+) / protein_length=113 / sequence_SO=supercontig / SO=protein_coding / is_pseudo=false
MGAHSHLPLQRSTFFPTSYSQMLQAMEPDQQTEQKASPKAPYPSSDTAIRIRQSISSIATADVNDDETADEYEELIAGEDEDDNYLSSPSAFFSSLLCLLNGEEDLRSASIE